MTDEDRELVTSFLENAQGEEYERDSALFSQLCFKAPHIRMSEEQTSVTGRTYDETFSRNMRKMWVQFARTDNPSLSADISPDGKAYEDQEIICQRTV